MSTPGSRSFKSRGRRGNGGFEAGQAALAIILGVVLVMVSVPLAADLLVNGQQAVVHTSQNQQQALQAAQAGLVDFENHVGANPYYAAASSSLGYCSANGNGASTFLNSETVGGVTYPGCTTPGTTDPNDPGFSNAFDPNCAASVATSNSSTQSFSYGWDLVSGSKANGSPNAEYQFIVDSRAVTSGPNGTIAAGNGATAYVFITGRSGSSGHYTCRSMKAAVNVLNPSSTTSTTTSAWNAPSITEPTPIPSGNQTVNFTIVGGSGAAGGNGFFVKGGTGGLGGSAFGSFTFPADFPTTPPTPPNVPIYFGTEVGLAGSLKPKSGNGGGTGYAAGGAAGNNSGGGGGASAFCIMPSGSASAGTCTPSMQVCPAITSFATVWPVAGSIPTTGCVLAIASGGGGGGGTNFLIAAGNGGSGGPSSANGALPSSGTPGKDFLGIHLNNNGKAPTITGPGGVGGNGGWIFIPTKNGGNGSGPGSGTGGTGASYGFGNSGGGGGAGYYGGGGGGAGFLIDGGGGGGAGISWAGTWNNYVSGSPVTVSYPGTPAGTVNGSASLSVTTQSSQSATTTYLTNCTGTASTPSQQVTAPTVSGATWTSVTAALAGGGGGGGAVPPEHSTQPYSAPGGVGGYIGGSNGSANGTVTLNVNGASGSATPPSLSYVIGCGGAGGTWASSAGVAGAGGTGFGNGGNGGVGKNAGSANNGGTAASGGGGGASALCLGTTCAAGTSTCTSGAAGASCAIAIAAGGGGGAEGTSDQTAATPPGPGGPGAGLNGGKLTNGTTVSGTCNFEPGANYKNNADTWYWPGDAGSLGNNYPNAVPGSGTQGSSLDTWGNGSYGSCANGQGGAGGSGGTVSFTSQGVGTAGLGGSSAGGCSGGSGGVVANGGAGETASCESAGGGGGGGFYGGGGGGGATPNTGVNGGGGYGGGGGSSYLFNYLNSSGVASPTSALINPTTGTTPITVKTTGTPFVAPAETATYTGPGGSPPGGSGAAGAGATTTSTTVGKSGSAGQPGVLTLTWNYVALAQPVVTDSCTPVSGELVQGSGTNTATKTYFPEIGLTTFELAGGAGGSSLTGSSTPGGADVAFVTVNVQPNEVFSYVSACSGMLSIGGPGFAQGGSSGNLLTSTGANAPAAWDLWAGSGTGYNSVFYIGETDTGGEAGGGGGASALCSGIACNPLTPVCSSAWTTATNCALAIAGGGGGAGAESWENVSTPAACSASSPNGGIGAGGSTISSPQYSSGLLTPGQNGSDGASGGDNGSGIYAPAPFTAANDVGGTSTFATTANSVSVFGTAGGGGGYDGGQSGQSLSECAGGGGSAWWVVATGIDAVTGSMTNPTTGQTQTTTGPGSVTILGFSNNVTAARSAALGSTSW